MTIPPLTANESFQLGLSRKAFLQGRDVPARWATEYDDGADGCMPKGWYITGMRANGFPCDYPIRHEYGPFDTEAEAVDYVNEQVVTAEGVTPGYPRAAVKRPSTAQELKIRRRSVR